MKLGTLGNKQGRDERIMEAGPIAGDFLYLQCNDGAHQKGPPSRTLATTACSGRAGQLLKCVGRVGRGAVVKQADGSRAKNAD